MSGITPRPARGIQPTAIGPAPYSAQGMVAVGQFVQPNGDLAPVSFRFLNSLFQAVSQLQGQLAPLQDSVQALQANVQALQATVRTLQGEVPH